MGAFTKYQDILWKEEVDVAAYQEVRADDIRVAGLEKAAPVKGWRMRCGPPMVRVSYELAGQLGETDTIPPGGVATMARRPSGVGDTQTPSKLRGFLGGCELRNCRHFRGLVGGPAEWGDSQTPSRPRRASSGTSWRPR